MNATYIRYNLFRFDTKFGIGSLMLAVVLIKCLGSWTLGSGFDTFLSEIHIVLALMGASLCVWGYWDEAREHEEIDVDGEGHNPGVSEDSDPVAQAERDD